jgi:hypothetical protein
MNARFITWVIIGVSFGFTQLWFAFWVVKLFKEKQRILKIRREASGSTASAAAAKLPGKETSGPVGPPGS